VRNPELWQVGGPAGAEVVGRAVALFGGAVVVRVGFAVTVVVRVAGGVEVTGTVVVTVGVVEVAPPLVVTGTGVVLGEPAVDDVQAATATTVSPAAPMARSSRGFSTQRDASRRAADAGPGTRRGGSAGDLGPARWPVS
jgi:hypothetical protein